MKVLLLIVILCLVFTICLADQYTEEIYPINTNTGYIGFNQEHTFFVLVLLEDPPWYRHIVTVSDGWDVLLSRYLASRGFWSFPIYTPPIGYHIENVIANFYVNAMAANDTMGVYPYFNFSYGGFSPNCLLDHVDFGSLGSEDVFAPYLDVPHLLLNEYADGWIAHDITSWVLNDIASNRQNTQLRVRLHLDSDWDLYADGIGFGNISNHPCQLTYLIARDTGILTGQVFDVLYNQPIEGAMITSDSLSATSNANGYYSIELEAGPHQILCLADSVYQEQTISLTIIPDQDNVLDFNLQPYTGILTGQVRNANTNLPIAGATISCNTITTSTDYDGNYFLILPIGNHQICCSSPEFMTQYLNTTILCDEISDLDFDLQITGNEDEYSIHEMFRISNAPNPFSLETTISYSVKHTQLINISIYNLKGEKVLTLVNESKANGNHSVIWDGRDNLGNFVSNGIYFYKLTAPGFTVSKKCFLIK